MPYELVIASAHRNPAKVHEWASTAADRGLKVIIAAAGKAAHLGRRRWPPTPPLPCHRRPHQDLHDLGGLDSLLSMVQMPSGRPGGLRGYQRRKERGHLRHPVAWAPRCPSTARRWWTSSSGWPRPSPWRPTSRSPRRSPAAVGAPQTGAHTPVSTPAHRGGDESYHAPVGNPHAAANAGRAVQGFVPVTSANADAGSSRHGRRTDPYDLSGRRENNPKRRRNRIISGILFALGIILILVAAGMWGYNQWQYHEQDQINEKLAAYATIDPKGSEAPVVDWASLKAVNQDVVGWVQIPNTVVNFPVYQGADNDEYLHTNAEGSYSLGGQDLP